MFNVALIGYGLAGRVFHAPLIAAVEGFRLAAIVSSRNDEIKATYPDATICASAEDVFTDPSVDLVVVATPNDSHFDLAAGALAAGKHVVIDKPFARTAAEARELIARSTGRILSVFQNRRWDSDFLTLRRLITDGSLGELAYVESHFDLYRPTVQDRWREWSGPSTGIWFDLGAHLVDQALQLFGPPLGLTADLADRREGAHTTDYFHVQLRYETLRVILSGNSLARATDLRLVVHGSRASFIKEGLDQQQADMAAGIKPTDSRYGVDPRPGRLILPGGREQVVNGARGNYHAFYEGVRDAMRGCAPLPVTASEALAVMDLLEAGEASSRERREIAFT